MEVSRDELERSTVTSLKLENYDDAVRQLQWIASLGFPPPTKSINQALTKAGSNVRLWEGKPEKVEVNGPHGGGCDIRYPMSIRKLNSARSVKQFEYVVKVRWDRDGGWGAMIRKHIARGTANLIVNKVAPHTAARIARSIGIIDKRWS